MEGCLGLGSDGGGSWPHHAIQRTSRVAHVISRSMLCDCATLCDDELLPTCRHETVMVTSPIIGSRRSSTPFQTISPVVPGPRDQNPINLVRLCNVKTNPDIKPG